MILLSANSYFDNADARTDNSSKPEQQSAATRLPAQNARGVTAPAFPLINKKASGSGATGQGLIEAVSGVTPIRAKPSWTGMKLFRDPTNTATQYALENPSMDGINYIRRMGETPVAQWFGDWDVNITNDVNRYVTDATNARAVPVLVIYNIPNRDCGGYSVGGAGGISNYTDWVSQAAKGISNRTAVIILEPDALGALDCLPSDKQTERLRALSEAVAIFKKQSNVSVYIDAGTPVWQSTSTMASRLNSANISTADGFSLNVSYFAATGQNQTYGDQLSKLVGNSHYVIDTSRNGGNHTNLSGMQCNPSFASLGTLPSTNTGNPRNDALLWIKIPWESDGSCNGSPNPGVSFWSYAIMLAKNAGW